MQLLFIQQRRVLNPRLFPAGHDYLTDKSMINVNEILWHDEYAVRTIDKERFVEVPAFVH